MKEKPILFSGPMVRAILEGRKTMTRRVVKPQPAFDGTFYTLGGAGWSKNIKSVTPVFGHSLYYACPYGVPGDRLWVRETHYAFGRWVLNGQTKTGRPKWKFVRASQSEILFEEPNYCLASRDKEHPGRGRWYKRLARFMPKSYARIWLEVAGVRVERLWQINEADALQEGIFEFNGLGIYGYDKTGTPGLHCCDSERGTFLCLWEKINGVGSWKQNPWVWVIEFKRIV
jgi:hypothetical protein